MGKRLLINEEEKNRILSLHKSILVEQGDYKMDKEEKMISKLDSLAKDFTLSNTTSKNEESNKLKPGLYYFSVKGCGSCEKYSSSVWPEIENYLKNTNLNLKKIVFDDFEGEDIEKVRKELSKMGAKDSLSYFPQVKIISKDDIVIYENPYPKIEDLIPELEKSFGIKIEVKKQDEKKSEENIVKNFDRKYNYKKEGDKYYFQLKSKPESWTEATGSARSAIGTQVFGDKSACVFPSEIDACSKYDGKEWKNNPESDKIDISKTRIGFCSKNYCSVKWIQDGLNYIISGNETVGHEKLKGLPELKLDGKFGTNTQNYIFKLLGRVDTTIDDISKQAKKKK